MADLNAQLAETGAVALVGAAGTDGWVSARAAYAELLARGDDRRRIFFRARLDEMATSVGETGDADREVVRRQLIPIWQTRLGDLLHEHPDLAPILAELNSKTVSKLPAARQVWIQNVSAGPGGSAYGVQHGNQYIHHHHQRPDASPQKQWTPEEQQRRE